MSDPTFTDPTSPSLPPPDTGDSERPFVIEHLQRDVEKSGTFRPDARLQITPALRTSGLLRELSGEDFKHLVLVFTFLSANGICQPSIQELAHAMKLSEGKMRLRLERLIRFEWQGTPLLTLLVRPNGLDAYAPARSLFSVIEAAPTPEPAEMLPNPTSHREEVIAYSRAHYTRPREEVERQIAEMNGWTYPLDAAALPSGEPASPLHQALLSVGLTYAQAEQVLSRFDTERIERQLAWLKFRHAIHPDRLLLAAIEHDYGPPPAIRLQQAVDHLDTEEPPEEENEVETLPDAAVDELDVPTDASE